MNKKVIFIFVLTMIALITLTLYSFGPLSNSRKQTAINPASLRPAVSDKVSINNKGVIFNVYHNKDVKENYYGIKLPQDWQTKSGQNAGSYAFTYPEGNGSMRLIDVPDNTTLELFILSQKEPELKNSVASYSRVNYKKLTINNNEAYELVFDSVDNGKTARTEKVYVAGPDRAALITFSAQPSAAVSVQSIFSEIINSFQWENK